MKRVITLFVLCLLCFPSILFAQVTITATGGTGSATYPDFTDAFAAINNGTHTGTITVTVTASFSQSTSVTPTIEASGTAAASYTAILIRPAAGISPVITSTLDNSATIKLNGADNITIDGSNNGTISRDMTIQNSNTSGSGQACNIWLASNGTDGATNNVIKNCRLMGSSSSGAAYMGVCIYSSKTALSGYWLPASATTGANSYNLIQNNLLSSANAAIVFKGGDGIGETGNRIIGNTIGDVTALANRKFTNVGINMLNQTNFSIERNTINWMATTNSNVTPGGISIELGCANGTISRNTMMNLRFSNLSYVVGAITLKASINANIGVYNNFIYDVASNGTTIVANNAYGIAIASGTGYHVSSNSVYMNTLPTATANAYQAALYLAAGSTDLNIRNNLFIYAAANSTNKFSVYSASANPASSVIDYNLYYTTAAPLAFAGAIQATLADVQANFQNNLTHLKNILPVFVSSTDLHLAAANASNTTHIAGAGVTIPGAGEDIDGAGRPISPTIGAHELLPAACVTPVAPTLSVATLRCGPGSVTLTAVAPAGTTLNWYTAATGGTLLSSGTNFATPVLTASTTYYVSAVRFNNCESNRIPIVATVNPNPVVDLGKVVEICADGMATRTLDAGNPGASYLWDDGSAQQTRIIKASGTYSVTVTLPTNCKTSDVVTANFHSLPVVDLGADVSFCKGFSALLDARNAGATYLWDDGSREQSRTVFNAGQYFVTVTDSYNCKGSDSVFATFKPAPTVDLGNDTTLCNGLSLVLDAGNDGSIYIWSTGAQSHQITANVNGQYRVTVSNSLGCTTNDTINITLSGELPSYDGISITNDGAYTFSFSLIEPENVETYEWNFGDGTPVSNLPDPVHTYPDATVYLVTLTTTSSCGSRTDTRSSNIVGIPDVIADNKELIVYPNPANGAVQVLSQTAFILKNISVYNMLGLLIYKDAAQADQKHTLNLNGYAPGNYILLLLTDKGYVSRRLTLIP